ncbi:MAG TPA: hypothetical protein PKD64_06240 [Pirellulaceae bacterium]|nr:hypothetical protein [Pirellulaceae bacterium]HMO91780.1 hypothetical protein [Pirellulaceae bacterium]HMP69579.1 hypothetical protein [Pirellulaceae bacterium]
MFGKAEWFGPLNEKKILRPITKQGTKYYGIWGGVILLPTLLLIASNSPFHAMIWLLASTGTFAWDYRKTVHEKREAEAYEKLYFIGEPSNDKVETERYVIRSRD